jgi:hypothetical protein
VFEQVVRLTEMIALLEDRINNLEKLEEVKNENYSRKD